MYFPPELWKEIKDFAGIYHLSTDWSFSYIYDGNWIQFYLEWFHPTPQEIHQIKDAHSIKEEIFTRAFSLENWKRIHFLNRIHQQYKHNAILPILRNCNALLEVKPCIFTKEYDMIEIVIPYEQDNNNEVELLQAIHSLLDRCHLTRLFYCYQKDCLILTVNVTI
jgi:hypothetical protein